MTKIMIVNLKSCFQEELNCENVEKLAVDVKSAYSKFKGKDVSAGAVGKFMLNCILKRLLCEDVFF